ncbi:MAG: methyltransferase domain-containing protein [Spirochaetaceae bacterium]
MDKKEQMEKIFKLLNDSWTGAALSAGMSAGIFNTIQSRNKWTQKELAQELDFDQNKLDMWLYFAEHMQWVTKVDNNYSLTDYGMNFTKDAGSPDIKGLLQLSQYYLNAASHADETFKPHKSLDKLSDGKISREYQPRVSDNFSIALKDLFIKHDFKPNETLLDVGCGNGSFLRNIGPHMVDIKLVGVDTNLFAIEKGKQINKQEKPINPIKLLAGDITEDMDDFKDKSYDWVTSINVMHFIDMSNRLPVIENMIRIAKKGVFITQVMIESTPLSRSANPLMGLLWNDFTGFFYKNEIDNINRYLQSKFLDHSFKVEKIMHGNSSILIIEKK